MKNNKDDTPAAPADLLEELRALVAEAEALIADSASEHAADAIESLRSRFDAARERLTDAYAGTRKRVIAGAKQADETIREYPYQSLAIAAGVGLLVGVLAGPQQRQMTGPAMETDRTGSTGVLDSLRSLGDGLLGSVQDRLELFSIELQEEKLRVVRTFVWVCVTVFLGMMAVMFASLTVVYLFWESARLAVLAGLTVLYAGALGATMLAFQRFLSRQPKPFAATLHEIGEDRGCIRHGN